MANLDSIAVYEVQCEEVRVGLRCRFVLDEAAAPTALRVARLELLA
jgi:hypothetical protein